MSKNANIALPKIGAPGQQRRLTVQLDADLAADLDLYAAAYEEAYGDRPELETLVPHILRRFIETDRSFKKWKSAKAHADA